MRSHQSTVRTLTKSVLKFCASLFFNPSSINGCSIYSGGGGGGTKVTSYWLKLTTILRLITVTARPLAIPHVVGFVAFLVASLQRTQKYADTLGVRLLLVGASPKPLSRVSSTGRHRLVTILRTKVLGGEQLLITYDSLFLLYRFGFRNCGPSLRSTTIRTIRIIRVIRIIRSSLVYLLGLLLFTACGGGSDSGSQENSSKVTLSESLEEVSATNAQSYTLSGKCDSSLGSQVSITVGTPEHHPTVGLSL